MWIPSLITFTVNKTGSIYVALLHTACFYIQGCYISLTRGAN